jgi:hypothetical protein
VRHASILPLLLAAAVFGAACSASNPIKPGQGGGGAGTGGSTGSQAQTLAIAPLDAVIDLPGSGAPSPVAYKATIGGKDVTATASFSLDDPSLGSFAGATFTPAGQPGRATVHCVADGQVAETSLTIKTQQVIITTGAPADAPGKFGGAIDPSKAPSLVYPADGTMVPPNMNVLELHFLPGANNDLFELTFSAALLDVKVYLTCSPLNGGCAYTPDAKVWKLVAEAGRGLDPIKYTLRGVSSASPGAVGVSATQTISFGEEDMLGGLYYWNAAGSTMRYEFGKSGQSAETYMNAFQAGAGTCVGCHVLSRDGKRIVEGMDIPGPAAYKVFDVATKSVLFGEPGVFTTLGANFFSFSPDNKQLMASDGNSIVLRDVENNGNALADPLVKQGTMPDWSSDGKTMVYAKGPAGIAGFGNPGVSSASLETLTFDGTTWNNGPSLVPYTGQNNFYPSYSPDNAWVLFNRSASNQNSYDAPDARCWVVSAAGGKAIQLAVASTGGDSWPKWAPIVQKYKGGSLLWLTFSSRRAYGLRLGSGNKTAQIWMTAFDPVRAAKGEDASFPAFWLPFQDIKSGNHIAQWVLHVDRKPCTTNGDCDPSEICGAANTCVPNIQ